MKKFLSLLLILTSLAQAGTEGGGGGGDAVILPDGSVVLADAFLDQNAPQPNNMPKAIALNPMLLAQIQIYNKFLKQLLESSKLLDVSSDLLIAFEKLGKQKSDLTFYVVKDADELNDFCASGGRKVYTLEVGMKVEQVACTNGDETFLVEPLFRRMNQLQQALLLLHERLTVFKDKHGGKNYQAIAGFTSGFYKTLELAYEQQKGSRRALTENELTRVKGMYESILELEYRVREIPSEALNWRLHKLGGGVVRSGAEIDETAFLGITSGLENGAQVDSSSVITDTHIPGALIIGKNVVIDDSYFSLGKNNFREAIVRDGTKLIRSNLIMAYDGLSIGADSQIEDSTIKAEAISVGRNFKMVKSLVDLTNPARRSGTFIVGDDQEMNYGEMFSDSNEYAPVGAKVQYPIAKSFGKTSCDESLRKMFRDGWGASCLEQIPSGKPLPRSVWETSMAHGIVFKMKKNYEMKRLRELGLFVSLSEMNDTYVVTRSIEVELSFTPIIENKPGRKKYLVDQEQLKLAGEKLLRTFKFSDPYGALEKELQRQGLTVETDPAQNFSILLKWER